jgi:hypothetical protein
VLNSILVNPRAEDFMACRGEAVTGYKTYVATPDYRQSHSRISFLLSGRLNRVLPWGLQFQYA